MKKLLSITLFLLSFHAFPQGLEPLSLNISWDKKSVDYSTDGIGGIDPTDPTADPTDLSNKLLEIKKPADADEKAGLIFGNPDVNDGGFPEPIPFTETERFITIRIYSTKPAGTPMMAKIEVGDNSGIFVEKEVLTTVGPNEWENLVFDFGSGNQESQISNPGISDKSGNNPNHLLNNLQTNFANPYSKLSFFPDYGQPGDGTTYLIDNVSFGLPPTIYSFSPTSQTAGNPVTILGKNFTGLTGVSFGGAPAASFNLLNSNTIVAFPGVGFSGDVRVITEVSSDTIAGFTFIAAPGSPTISTIFPASASTGGVVSINGTNFNTATAVYFGGNAAASFTVVSATNITAVIGSGSSGIVSVSNPNGVAIKPGFTFLAPTPVVSAFTPTSAGSGDTVSITGSNFVDVDAVTFGGTPTAYFVVKSPTLIKTVVNTGTSGLVEISNTGGTGSLAGFTFKAPISLPINFNSSTVDYKATDFGGNISTLAADPIIPANQALRISKPIGARRWAWTTLGKDFAPKVNNGGLASAIPFTATNKVITARVYSPLPVGTQIVCKVASVNNASINAEVKAFTTVQNGWSTLFWNFSSVNIANSYQKISFFMDYGNGGSASSIFYLDDVAIVSAPGINSFLPTTGSIGTTLTIKGTKFTGVTEVSLGSVPAASFTVVNDTTITAVLGLGASGQVSVARSGATATLAGFTFFGPGGATVSSFLPTSAGEGTLVTITGTNFLSANGVSFGGTPAASFNIVNGNTITAIPATGSSGSISVNNPIGIGSLPGFTFIPKAPISFPITWDNPTTDYSTEPFGGANMISSPDVDPLIPTNKVLKLVKGIGAQDSAGVSLGKFGIHNGGFPTEIQLTPSNRFVKVRFYSPRPIGSTVRLRMEQGNNPALYSEAQVVTTLQNGWEILVFDFGNIIGGRPINYSSVKYNKLTIFPDYGNPGAASANTYFVDNVELGNGPLISSFSPISAATGTTVTINGENFAAANAVNFGGVAATSFTVVNNNQITATVGAGFSGNVEVTTFGNGSRAGFDWIAPPGPPSISSFTPNSAFSGGLVTINGSNFNTVTNVSFGGTSSPSFTVINSSVIKAIVGPGTSGSVSVTNSFGSGSVSGFTFKKKPISLPINWNDFATVELVSGDIGQVVSTLIADPLDNLNTVLQLTKSSGGAGGSGTFLGNSPLADPVPFSFGNTIISVRFYSPVVGLPVLLRLDGTAPIEKLVTSTKVGWQILTFDFSAVINFSHIYNKLLVFPGYNTVPGTTQVSYVGDIIFGNFSTNNWIGAASSNFLTGSNWSLGFPPTDCNINVQINAGTAFSPVLSVGSGGAGNVDIKIGASLMIGAGATFSVCGNIINGDFVGPGTVVLNGSDPQTFSGNQTVNNITINKPPASGMVTVNGTTRVKGVATLSNANSSLVVGGSGNLILTSDATGTGSIAAIPAGASVSGNVTQQRYFTGTGDGWFLLGTPIQGGNFSQWTDNIYMAAGTSLGGNQGVIPLGIQHSTIFDYDDAFHYLTFDTVQKRGWRVPVSGNMLIPGKGFRVWLKSYSAPTRTLDNVGPITSGSFNFPTLYRTEQINCQPNLSPQTQPCDESFRGWNLLANPYPSAIDWDATGGAWTKPASMLNGFWRWNKAGYGVYSGGTYAGTGPAPVNPNVIASGQGFFVKLQTPGTYTAILSVDENAKSSSTNSFLRTVTSTANNLYITLEKNGLTDYNFINSVRFDENATDGKDLQMDVPNLTGSGFYFTTSVENEQMVINSFGPLTETKIVPIQTQFMGSLGMHRFILSGLESFPPDVVVYLKDHWAENMENISENPTYSFEVNPSNINMINRFELIFSTDGVTSNKSVLNGNQLILNPNPANSKQVLLSFYSNQPGKAKVQISDILGKVVVQSDFNAALGKNQTQLDVNLPSGIYHVKVTTATKEFIERLMVR